VFQEPRGLSLTILEALRDPLAAGDPSGQLLKQLLMRATSELAGDLLIAQALAGEKHDPGTIRQRLRHAMFARQRL
jgi:hypothetical protein